MMHFETSFENEKLPGGGAGAGAGGGGLAGGGAGEAGGLAGGWLQIKNFLELLIN